jgi:malto-oligosyltrehalose trehalohydrolase
MQGGMRRQQALLHGAECLPEGGVRFRLWAPAHKNVMLDLDGQPKLMRPADGGWHNLDIPTAGAGSKYLFVLPDGTKVPDPASRFQPEDVHGPSEVIDPTAHDWLDSDWKGRPWHEAVVYELHVGAFTLDGTFRAAMERLDYLVDLGVTAIEIMPVSDFPGGRNWGYDGVLPYAPDSSYGRPEDFKAFVQAAHARGVMVILDVVYNHFGPDGNFLPAYAPQFFTDRHKTPWGAAINYDGEHSKPVREFVIQNALYWITEFNLDGLRLDAVHAIMDDGPKHLLDELAEQVRSGAGRPVHLILENEENQASRLARRADGEPLTYSAQWNDDVHHVLHVAATGEDKGYYVEYLGDTEKLGRALAEGFAFQGQMMAYRGENRGEPSAQLPSRAFVTFIQNHDQVGNRAFGDRISDFAPALAVRAIAAVYLLLPQVPMIFMGEEWAAKQPFPFFCDFDGDLADAVRKGRREEFAKFPEFQDEEMRERIPDPQAPETFASAKLDWADLERDAHAETLAWYREILDVRKREITPLIPHIGGYAGQFEVVGPDVVTVSWNLDNGKRFLRLEANLSARPVSFELAPSDKLIWLEGALAETGLAPWSVRWTTGSHNNGE